MPLFERFDRAIGRLYHYIGTLVGISIGLFAVAISLDLILRLLGMGNLPGVQEIIEYMLFTGVFLSAPWALRLGAHVRVDLLISNLPAGAAQFLNKVLDATGLVICLVLIWFGWVNLSQAYSFNSMQIKYFHIPEWWLLTVFVISFTLLAFEFFSRLVRGAIGPSIDSETPGGM